MAKNATDFSAQAGLRLRMQLTVYDPDTRQYRKSGPTALVTVADEGEQDRAD